MTKYGNKAIIYSCIKGVRGNRKHTLKTKNLKALKANRYAEVKRNGGIVRVIDNPVNTSKVKDGRKKIGKN